MLWQVSNSFRGPGSTHAALEERQRTYPHRCARRSRRHRSGGLNNFGQIVGSYGVSASGGYKHGFLDTNGVITTIDDPNAGSAGHTLAYGINDWGQIVGTYCDQAPASVMAFSTRTVISPQSMRQVLSAAPWSPVSTTKISFSSFPRTRQEIRMPSQRRRTSASSHRRHPRRSTPCQRRRPGRCC